VTPVKGEKANELKVGVYSVNEVGNVKVIMKNCPNVEIAVLGFTYSFRTVLSLEV